MTGLLIYTRRTLFPVFSFSDKPETGTAAKIPRDFSFPRSIKLSAEAGSVRKGLHAIQGIRGDLAVLESALEKKNILPTEKFDYDLMSLECTEPPNVPVPKGLIIRKPGEGDLEALFPLQRGYEFEEVLPKGAEFNPQSCRRNLEGLIKNGIILAAELNGVPAGKININAESFSRFQIGGVYVAPEFRGRGIAQSMTEAMIRYLLPQGKNFTLFVKKRNPAARRVYDKLGFVKTADYGIEYFL
jgi:predicted GNAT family acetyltransferase